MKKNEFKPAWWLRNSHLQTLWPAVLRKPIKNLPIERERFELYDGDFVDLDWVGKDKTGPLVLILHGFEGSIESHYAKGMIQALDHNGWRSAFVHFRGCSGEPNRLPRSYHSGETNDIANVAAILHEREPDTKMAAIGYSLGGNILLKWLGETRKQNPLCAAIAISVPFELHKAACRIQKGFSRFYQWYFLKCLRERLLHKFQHVPSPINPEIITEVQTIMDFDEHYTAPLHGFSGVDDYYSRSSSRQYLRYIEVPTLLLHAKDDPFMTEDVIPNIDELSPTIKLEVSETGGHVGFVGGRYPWRPEYWLEKRVPDFIRDYF
ncbi:MAG: hypothetical protein ACD_46C00601G0004 [uncultured bacterium]|nr:MAG: hypothetical protein ACD_46C00601G0004 [uncultured bacterium]